ncbi:MAG: 3-deoxy-7-phosphoheptulonate synthase, partial [Dyella sp.]
MNFSTVDAASAQTLNQSTHWSPSSWQERPALQQPLYEDTAELTRATDELARLPPLVTSWEVLALKQALAEA